MNRIVKTFEKAFETAKRKNWDRIYVAVDSHETVLKPTWSKTLSHEYYEYAKETLQLLSQKKEICLILWSCSLPEFNQQYLDSFAKDGINFDYVNENPECPSTDYANFDLKLYFSLGLDDKFGFMPNEDWKALHDYLTGENSKEKELERLIGLLSMAYDAGKLLRPDIDTSHPDAKEWITNAAKTFLNIK